MFDKLARSLLVFFNTLTPFSFLSNQLDVFIVSILNELFQLLIRNASISKNTKTKGLFLFYYFDDRTFHSILRLFSINYTDGFVIKVIENMHTLGRTDM